jgi:hypothetical protein
MHPITVIKRVHFTNGRRAGSVEKEGAKMVRTMPPEIRCHTILYRRIEQRSTIQHHRHSLHRQERIYTSQKTTTRMHSPLRALVTALLVLGSLPTAQAQSLLSIFRIICPIFKIVNLELNFCKKNVKPVPPVKPPVKAPVAPAPTASAPSAPKAPSAPAPATAPVAPSAPKAPAAPAAPSVPTSGDRAPIAPVFVSAPTGIAPTRVEPPIILSLPTPKFTLLNFVGKFNPVGSSPICIALEQRNFTSTVAAVSLRLNNVVLTVSSLTPSLVCSNAGLVNGVNAIALLAKDSGNFDLEYQTVVWAGSNTITVNLVTDATPPAPFTAQTVIKASLSDDNGVVNSVTTSSGSAVFGNLPPRTIVFTAQTTGSSIFSGSVAGTGGDTSTVTLIMTGFLPPSTINNNDLSLGTTAGWTYDTTLVPPVPVIIVPHVLNPGPPVTYPETDNGLVNNDISLTTRRIQGETKLSRSFTTRPGITGVLVRYRFVTNEFPEWVGSKYNDYFRVRVRVYGLAGSTYWQWDGLKVCDI